MEFKDYYKTMGLARTASADEIKKAYRRLARKHHPDVSKAADASERMVELNEATEATCSSYGRDVGTTMIRAMVERPYICGATSCPPRGSWCCHAGRPARQAFGQPRLG